MEEEVEEEKKKKGRKRPKGLEYVGEVKKILERNGCQVEGPGYKLRWFPKKGGGLSGPFYVHTDYFGLYDLISFREDLGFMFHQVSIIEEKSRKVGAMLEAKKGGWFWGRVMDGKKAAFKTFVVEDGTAKEREGVILARAEGKAVGRDELTS